MSHSIDRTPSRIAMADILQHIDPENVSIGQLYVLILQMRMEGQGTQESIERVRQEFHEYKVDQLKAQAAVKHEFQMYKDSQKDMLATWATARGVLNFVKLLAAIGLPIGVILAWLGFQR